MTSMFPESIHLPLEDWANDGLDWLIATYGDAFETAADAVLFVIVTLEQALLATPWWAMMLAVAAIAAHATRGWKLPLGLIAALFLIGSLGLWDLAMQTLALMLVSVGLAVLIGLPLGIAISLSSALRVVTRPVLDAMQTMPSFVYLIPALMLFGLGKVPAVFATVIYATPPLVRLTDLGLRDVDPCLVEAAADLGAAPRRQLVDIRLPLARAAIMAGINQTTMLALSMVVIASMIGARGLGEEVLLGIQRLDVGRGLAAGIAIVALAVIFDRITQAYGGADRDRVPGA